MEISAGPVRQASDRLRAMPAPTIGAVIQKLQIFRHEVALDELGQHVLGKLAAIQRDLHRLALLTGEPPVRAGVGFIDAGPLL